MISSHNDSAFRLLDLPAELRNRIYRYSVVCIDKVEIRTDGYARPALLKARHQIRKEALAIFYAENDFLLQAFKYESTPAYRFRITLPSLERSPRIIKSADYCRKPHCLNLLLWLKIYHAGKIAGVRSAAHHGANGAEPDLVADGGLFSTVKSLRDLPWRRVSAIVRAQRPVLAALDHRWAKNWM